MTALTPQQMRDLADQYAGVFMEGQYGFETPIPEALRSAANQLEAVRTVVADNSFQAFDGEVVVYSDLVIVALEEIAEDNK